MLQLASAALGEVAAGRLLVAGAGRSRLDEVGKKLKRAFSDTAPALKQEQAALRERMTGCR